MCLPRNHNVRFPKLSRSTGGLRCPPVMITARAPIAWRASAADCMSSLVRTEKPASVAASSRFGVMTVASRSRLRRTKPSPGFEISSAPEDERTIGSSTMGTRRLRSRNALTTRAASSEPSIPILTAAMLKSDASSVSVWVIVRAATGWTRRTPRVDCTVSAVMQEIP